MNGAHYFIFTLSNTVHFVLLGYLAVPENYDSIYLTINH